jgi:hypothetical protein
MASHVADIHFSKPQPRFWLWYGILIGPISWALDQQISYSLVAHSCSTGHFYLMHVFTAVFLLLALSGALVAVANLGRTREATIEGGRVADRSRFMAVVGVGASLGWAILIIAMAVPRFILSPCD